VVEALADHHLEGRRSALAVRDPGDAERERLDRRQPGGGRLLDDEVHEAGDPGDQLFAEVPGAPVGVADLQRHPPYDLVEGGEEAVLLVVEQFVEGGLGDAGQGDEVVQRRRGIAVAGHQLDHRRLEARPLVLGRLLRRDPPWPSFQPREERLGGEATTGVTRSHAAEHIDRAGSVLTDFRG
jgi:hypothetical protein